MQAFHLEGDSGKHGGGTHKRDRTREGSSNMCVEKPAATVCIQSLTLMGSQTSLTQVPASHSLGGQGAGVFILPLLLVTG